MIAGPHAAFSCYPRICGVQLLAPNFRPLYSRLCSQLLCPPRCLLCLLFLLGSSQLLLGGGGELDGGDELCRRLRGPAKLVQQHRRMQQDAKSSASAVKAEQEKAKFLKKLA